MSKKKMRSQQIISAPGPLTITNGERVETFLVRPPTPADMLTMERWMRKNARISKPKPQGISSAELEGLKPEQQMALLNAYAQAKAAEPEPTTFDRLEALHTPAGAAMMIWVSARKQHAALQLSDVQKLITDENVEQVLADFDDATAADDENGDPDPKADSAGGSPAEK